MIDELKIMLAQLNPTVGALSGNAGLAREAHGTAAKAGADLLVFPELFISGYPPEDLVLKPAFRGGLHGAGERACRTDGRRWRDRHADDLAVGRRRQAVQRGHAAGRWRGGGRALQARSAQLRRVRRKARVRRRSRPRPDQLPWGAHWCAHLRGHLDRRNLRDAGRDRRRAVHRAKRLAVRA
jgi:hypothetical protein